MEKEEAIREIKRFMSILPNDMQEAIMALVPELAESEEPEVDLEEEIDNYFDTIQAWQIQEAPFTTMDKCARHFYELGIKARKEK